jgi:integrase
MAKKPKPRPDGRYQVKRMVDGKAKFFYGATHDEAEAGARAAGQHTITKNDTLAVWFSYWLKNVVKANVAIGTYEIYDMLIKKHFIETELGRKRLRDITTQHLRQVLTEKLETLSARTVLSLHNFIKAALQQAVDDDILMRNPAGPIKRPKAAPKKDKYLETPVVRMLLQEANGYQKDLFLLAWTSGLRREEILGLCWSDFKGGALTVRRSVKKGGILTNDLKTPSAYRTVPLPPEAIQMLNTRKKMAPKVVSLTTPDLIFPNPNGKPYEPIVITRNFTRLCTRCKVDATFHSLRHTYATNLAIAGVHPARAQYLLGHSKAQMTLDGYTHLRGGDMDGIADIVAKMTEIKSSQESSQKTS